MKNKKALSITFFVLSIIVFPFTFAFCCTFNMHETVTLDAAPAFYWLFFALLPIPLFSLVFGIISTIKWIPAKKNIIAGAIAIFAMIAFGSWSAWMDEDKSGLFINEVSEATGIDLPTNMKTMTHYRYGGRYSNAIIEDVNQEEIFENETQSNRWVDSLTGLSNMMLPEQIAFKVNGPSSKRICMYINTTKDFNPTSLNAGRYEITLLMYESDRHHIFVFDQYIATIE